MDEVSLTGNNEEGLVKFKNGKEYYELLLQNAVGIRDICISMHICMKIFNPHIKRL